jgi:hypothetical protein
LHDFTVEKNSVSQNEVFSIFVRTRNISPEEFPGGQLGIALVNNNGNIVGGEPVMVFNWERRNPNTTGGRTINNCRVPTTVTPGRYRLRIMIRPTGGEWRIATMSVNDAPTSIDFTVR